MTEFYLPLGKQGIMEMMLINTQRMPLRLTKKMFLMHSTPSPKTSIRKIIMPMARA